MRNLAVWGSCPKRAKTHLQWPCKNVSCLAGGSLVGSWQLVFQRMPTSCTSSIWCWIKFDVECWICFWPPQCDTVLRLYILNLFVNSEQFLCSLSKTRGVFSYFRITWYTVFGFLWCFSGFSLTINSSAPLFSQIDINIIIGFLKWAFKLWCFPKIPFWYSICFGLTL